LTITVTTTTAIGPNLVNTTTADNQVNPAVALLGNGNYVVTWQSFNQEAFGLGYGLYGQIYSPGGVKVGSEFHVNTATNFDQSNPSIAATALGGFVVAYVSAAGAAIQRFDANGVKVGSEHAIPTGGPQIFPGPPVIAGCALGAAVATRTARVDPTPAIRRAPLPAKARRSSAARADPRTRNLRAIRCRCAGTGRTGAAYRAGERHA